MLVPIGFLYIGALVTTVMYDTEAVQFVVAETGRSRLPSTLHRLPLGPQHIVRGAFHVHRLQIDHTAFKQYNCWKALEARHFKLVVD